MILLRLSQVRESEENYFTFEEYQKAVGSSRLILFPKLMDIAVIYGKDNVQTVEKIFQNSFKNLPYLQQDAEKSATDICSIIKKIVEQVSSRTTWFNAKDLTPVPLSDLQVDSPLLKLEMKREELIDMHHYLYDIFKTIECLLAVHPSFLTNLYNQGFSDLIVKLYDKVLFIMIETMRSGSTSNQPNPKFLSRHNRIRRSFSSIVNHYIHHCYVDNIKNCLKHQNKKKELQSWVDDLFALISVGLHLEDSSEYFTPNHSIMVDLDRLFNFTPTLKSLNDSLSKGYLKESDARLEYAESTLGQLTSEYENGPRHIGKVSFLFSSFSFSFSFFFHLITNATIKKKKKKKKKKKAHQQGKIKCNWKTRRATRCQNTIFDHSHQRSLPRSWKWFHFGLLGLL